MLRTTQRAKRGLLSLVSLSFLLSFVHTSRRALRHSVSSFLRCCLFSLVPHSHTEPMVREEVEEARQISESLFSSVSSVSLSCARPTCDWPARMLRQRSYCMRTHS